MDPFYAAAGIVLLIAALVVCRLNRRLEATEQRANAAETEAAMAWGKGFRDATDEINNRRALESKISYDKGFETGWNTCVTQFEELPEHKKIAAA